MNSIQDYITNGLIMVIVNRNDGECEENHLFTNDDFKVRFPEVFDAMMEESEEWYDDIVDKCSCCFKCVADVDELEAYLRGEFNDHDAKKHNKDWYWTLSCDDFPKNTLRLPYENVMRLFSGFSSLSSLTEQITNAEKKITVSRWNQDALNKLSDDNRKHMARGGFYGMGE